MRNKGVIALCLLLAVLSGCDRQDAFPNRPILLICPWSPGGGTDSISRHIAFLLEQDLDVPVNVVNATGGSGVTGHTRGAIARPDGYTMTMVTVELSMLHWRSLTNISYKDFKPVIMLNQDAAALFVRTDSQWTSLGELQEAIRKNPGKLKASGTAFGAIWHVALAGWLTNVGLNPSDAIWIPMGGSKPSLVELMAGGVDMVCCSLPEARVELSANTLRCLGVMAEERVPAFADVPTFKELGVDWQVLGYRGLALPLGVPQDRYEILAAAARRAVTSDAYLEFVANMGADAAAMPSEEFRRFLAKSDEVFGEIMTSGVFSGVTRKYGAMFFPKLLLGLLVLCFLGCLGIDRFRVSEDAQTITASGMLDLAIAVGCIVLYLVLAEFVGFIVTAAVLLFLLFWRLRVRWIVALPVSLALVPLLYQIFAVGLRVPLPRGWLSW
ncbi:MAG: tripartite tricarboxylate transporter TctB family protein [Planctomycetes bacterium]|nr:tripartite tricarboxylate transporter TctB family protein [Planctomycetota bacterium]